MSNKQKVYSFQTLTLSTLAAATALLGGTKIDASRLQGCKIIDIFGAFTWHSKTTTEGPVYYGFTNGMSITEIAAVFAADPQSQDDPTGDDSMRRIIVVGSMEKDLSIQPDDNSLWRKIMWPKSWEIREGETFDIFAFNRDSGALTTGTELRFDGMFNTEWRQD